MAQAVIAGLSPRSPVFDPGSVNVGFVMDKMALRFSPVSLIPPVLHYEEKRKKTNHLHHRVAQ
jgi:hypothetical protein